MAHGPAQATYLFAALHVRDRDAALPFYERLFGRPPDFLPHDAEAVWRVADTASAYILADGTRVGGGEINLIVDDLDATLAGLSERAIDAGPIEVIEGAGRKARIKDPDGNAVWFTQLDS